MAFKASGATGCDGRVVGHLVTTPGICGNMTPGISGGRSDVFQVAEGRRRNAARGLTPGTASRGSAQATLRRPGRIPVLPVEFENDQFEQISRSLCFLAEEEYIANGDPTGMVAR